MTDAEAQQFLLTLLRSTGLGSYRAGDLLYASGPNTLSKLPAPTTTAMLLHGGEQPAWASVSMTDDVTGVLAAEHGGTGLSSYAVGDLLYASGATALAKLADVVAGSFLRSGGVATAPAWSAITIPNAAALGDLWYGSAANAISTLPGQTTTTRKFLRQTGDGTHSSAPAWDTLLAADVIDLSAALALKLDVTAYTAASVLAKLITVDGAGSGVDADFLDGISSAGFVAAGAYTAADVLAKLLTVDGAGSGLDADLLDGLSSAAFLQTSTYQALAPTWSAQHTFTAGSGALVLANTSGPILRMSDTDAAADAKHVRLRVINGALSISSEDDTLASVTTLLATSRSGAAWTNLALGNTTDNPTYSFLGTGAASFGGSAKSTNATGGIGYATGAGGAVTQGTSRTTGVTLNKICGAITLVSAAGSASYQTFTVTNSAVAATDVPKVVQKSGTDKYIILPNNVQAGSFDITFATTGGTTTEQPVFNFWIAKAVAA